MATVTTYTLANDHQFFSIGDRDDEYTDSYHSQRDGIRSQLLEVPSEAKPIEPISPIQSPDQDGLRDTSTSDIIDIRRDRSSPVELGTQMLSALSAAEGQKNLPSLMVWSARGQKHFHEVIFGKDYYPYAIENELICKYASNIASRIANSGSSVLVELGAGTMQKTGRLLSALDELNVQCTYYALDIDSAGLKDSIRDIKSRLKLRNITLRGLFGTYEDGAHWLASAPDARDSQKTFIWLGTSMGNCTASEASELLESLSRQHDPQKKPNFVIAMDGCLDPQRLKRAYDSPTGSNRLFIKSAITYGREVLGNSWEPLLRDRDWKVTGGWNAKSREWQNSLQPIRDLQTTIDGVDVRIGSHERLGVISCRKWNLQDISRICSSAGLKAERVWSDRVIDYGIYWLERQ